MMRDRVLLVFLVFALASRTSLAVSAIFREQVIPGAPGGLTQLTTDAVGASVWFTEFDANRIGMFTYDGQFREFTVPTPNSGPLGIALGSDAIWFTEYRAGKIGKLTLAGAFQEFPIPTPQSAPWGIAVPGGVPWFTESGANKIGRVNSDGSITEYEIPTKDAGPRGISAPDSLTICFAEFAANQIGCLENGRIVERALSPGSGPEALANRTNRADLWFTETTGNRIGVLHFNNVSGFAQAPLEEFPVPTPVSGLSGIAAESDGAWFAEKSAGKIGFISSRDARVTEYALNDRSSQPVGMTLSFFGARSLESAANRVVEIQPDAIVVAGGMSGRWLTETWVANVALRPTTVFAGRFPRPAETCAGSCPPGAGVSLAPNGSGQLNLNDPIYGILTYFVRTLEEGILPSVKARVSNRDLPSQAADLPTIRLSTLTSLNPKTLTFPGAIKNGSARSNLLVVDASVDRLLFGPVQTTRVAVDLLDAGGNLLASGQFAFLGGNNIYIVDIIGRLGITDLNGGQVRVTKIGDQGLLWGYLATINSDGAVSIFSGLNP